MLLETWQSAKVIENSALTLTRFRQQVTWPTLLRGGNNLDHVYLKGYIGIKSKNHQPFLRGPGENLLQDEKKKSHKILVVEPFLWLILVVHFFLWRIIGFFCLVWLRGFEPPPPHHSVVRPLKKIVCVFPSHTNEKVALIFLFQIFRKILRKQGHKKSKYNSDFFVAHLKTSP